MKAKPIGRARRVDHVSLAKVDLLRANALLSYLAYALKYAESEEVDTVGAAVGGDGSPTGGEPR